mmetsp:Transcript_51394/g.117495  ORF Transcript_51394/g.117495 Transcript_51394/m.117495 type:complete len:210 (-) Transcript_51394:84-713(-)
MKPPPSFSIVRRCQPALMSHRARTFVPCTSTKDPVCARRYISSPSCRRMGALLCDSPRPPETASEVVPRPRSSPTASLVVGAAADILVVLVVALVVLVVVNAEVVAGAVVVIFSSGAGGFAGLPPPTPSSEATWPSSPKTLAASGRVAIQCSEFVREFPLAAALPVSKASAGSECTHSRAAAGSSTACSRHMGHDQPLAHSGSCSHSRL